MYILHISNQLKNALRERTNALPESLHSPGFFAGKYAVAAYKEWKDSQPEEPIPSRDNDNNTNQATQDQPNADADAD